MNDAARREAVQATAKEKVGNKKKVKSKIVTHYKANLEREYRRLVNAYMQLLYDTLSQYLPDIQKAVNEVPQVHKCERYDSSTSDLLKAIQKTFDEMGAEFDSHSDSFGLRRKLEKLGNLTRKLTVKEWKKVVANTLGIDIADDYYLGEFYRTQMKQWTDTNVELIKSIPHESLEEMRGIVAEGLLSGKTTKRVMQSIRHAYGVSKSKAQFLARDQMAKLNADITQAQQEDAGVDEYIWSSSQDSRVRDRHRQLNGKKFKWSDPPVVDMKTGRRAHPGQDYQCRCVAIPVFDIDKLDLPMSGTANNNERGAKHV